ncbi:MAG TPA: DMT family transporter [Deltaproteobacteria bacterium]|nr:DMT family transporter [Deltaproteobacteria bacterium]
MTPPFPHAGEVCALLAPLCWAVAVIGFRHSDLPAISMNLFKNTVALVLLTATMGLLGIGSPADRSAADWGILAVSGVLGLAVADTLLLEGLRRIGAARLALVDTTYAPMMVLLSWLFLGEQLTASFLLGATVVVAGVAIATVDLRHAVARREPGLALGIAMALGAICGTGASVILVKPVLEGSNLIEVTWTRMLVGIGAQALWVTTSGGWRGAVIAFVPSARWRSLVPAAVMGTYVALVLWLGGFKWADASVAAVLNQLATVYILGLAWAVLGEPVGPRQVIGGLLAVVGATVVVSV